MSTLRVYCSTIPSVNFIMPNGKPVIFQQGRYYTDIPAEIAYLDAEIAAGQPHLYIDESQREIPSEDLDPMVAMKKNILGRASLDELRKALAAAEAAAIDPANDMGVSKQDGVKPASTVDIAAAQLGGASPAITKYKATQK